MKIYGSTQWVDSTKNKEWYQLEVINQWNWSEKAICFKKLDTMIISYCLKINTVEDTNRFCKTVTDITDEIKTELVNQGYVLSNTL
jgi:hypothetical protein